MSNVMHRTFVLMVTSGTVALSTATVSSAAARAVPAPARTSPSLPAVASQTAAAEAAYDRVAKAWSAQRSLEARFEQTITNSLLGKTMTSRGLFQQQRPNKVSITFTDPAGDRIVGDGKSLWVYLPSSSPGQVFKLPANADGAIVADLLGQLLDAPKKTFAISGGEAATVQGRATRRVQLVPRAPGTVPFQKATLWLDEKDPRPIRVQLLDAQGIDRTITLTTWTPDAKLAAKTFTFSPPKGVKVLTRLPGA
ncbi:MAG: outer membrane lipoprotein carrier protein LolA [Gemmatimonas sp.]